MQKPDLIAKSTTGTQIDEAQKLSMRPPIHYTVPVAGSSVGYLSIPPYPSPANQEALMPRWYVDCRDYPSESKCTVAISADSESELLEAAVRHAVEVHGHQDTQQFRGQLKQAIKRGTPPA